MTAGAAARSSFVAAPDTKRHSGETESFSGLAPVWS